tara:strand:+ start:38 stop:616 length:579 start_codon:yes stop_codon:yes gene_type:complete
MKLFLLFILAISMFLQTACGPLKYKKVSAKDYPPEPEKRIQKNMEEGRGFRILGGPKKGGGTFDFASSNPLWIATLDTLDFMPLVSANYSGGIVITDWYGENTSPNESIKISVRFLTNDIRSDALDVNIFIKTCSQNLTSCSISQKNEELVAELKLNILKKASRIEKKIIDKNKEENPYILNKPSKQKKNKN